MLQNEFDLKAQQANQLEASSNGGSGGPGGSKSSKGDKGGKGESNNGAAAFPKSWFSVDIKIGVSL